MTLSCPRLISPAATQRSSQRCLSRCGNSNWDTPACWSLLPITLQGAMLAYRPASSA